MVGTMQAKVEKADKKAKALVSIKVGKTTKVMENEELANRLREGLDLVIKGKKLEEGLKIIKEYVAPIADELKGDSGTITIKTDTVLCKVTFGYECVLPEENVAEARRILGRRFDDLVREKTTWTGNSELIDLASDADQGKAIRGLIKIKKKSPSITFSAVDEKAVSP